MAGRSDFGMISTPKQGNRVLKDVPWCADNGVFGKGYPGDDEFLAWLHRKAVFAPTCLFVVAPDVIGDAHATLTRSRRWLPVIRALGFPAALVAQDGMEFTHPPWDEFDVLFIGGSTDFKLGSGARMLVAEAVARGKWVHMGRVNSKKRLLYAADIGCHSADGTYLSFGPDTNLPKLESWLNALREGTS